MDVHFLSPSDPRWSGLLAQAEHDLYQLPEYVRIAARHEGGDPVALLLTDGAHDLLMPLVVRPLTVADAFPAPGYFDAVSPYGYAHALTVGPLSSTGPGDGGFVGAALSELVEALREHRIVTAFVRLHPLLPFPVREAKAIGAVVDHGQTVAIDLIMDPGAFLSGMRQNHVRRIKKGLSAGHKTVMASSPDDIAEFAEIYVENMVHVDATSYYYFSSDYFESLIRQLPGKVHLAFLEIEGRRACGMLLSEVCGIVQYHLGGTRSEFRQQSPMVLLTYGVASWARVRGNRIFHLGGGLGGRADSLFHFKAGFSSTHYPYRTWRIIADVEAFSRFTHQWEEKAGAKADHSSGFFPAYRNALPPPIPPGEHHEASAPQSSIKGRKATDAMLATKKGGR